MDTVSFSLISLWTSWLLWVMLLRTFVISFPPFLVRHVFISLGGIPMKRIAGSRGLLCLFSIWVVFQKNSCGLKKKPLSYTCVVGVERCVCHSVCHLSLPPCGLQGLNAGCQAGQAPLPAEPLSGPTLRCFSAAEILLLSCSQVALL